MATATITGKPNKKVSNLTSPTRGSGNRKMTSSWKVPAAMTKDDNKNRATDLVVAWKFNMGKGKKTLKKTYGTSKTSSTVNLNSFTIGSKSYNRDSFYPLKTDNKLKSVTISVKGKNSKGEGDAATQTRKFEVPRKPAIEYMTFNSSNGHCVSRITTNAGTDYKERYDTLYRVTVKTSGGSTINPSSGVTATVSDSTKYYVPEKALTSTDFTLEYDVGNYQSLTTDQYIQVIFTAWARGYAGSSSPVEKSYYVSRPLPATITSIKVSSKDIQSGLLTVGVDTNQTTQHPVDKVTLEYLANVSYENATDIPSGAQWEDSDIEDNGDCTALSVPLSIDENFVPDRGKYTWIRVRSSHANDAVLFNYSDYRRVEAVETPAAESAESGITIISATSGADGESAIVQLGWNASGTDDSTGTELSWADEEDTWRSTKDPDSYEFTWSDGRYPATGTLQYNDSANIVIKGLTEGRKYYIRARRYYEGETVSYGRYSNDATVIPSGKPAAVVASSKKYIAEGEPLQVYWTFSGNTLQTNWEIKDSNGTTVDDGEGSFGSTQISWERIYDLAVDNSLTYIVGVSTGSGFTYSDPITVKILEKPTLTVTAPSTLTTQPYSFSVASNRLCDLIVIVTAQGASGQFPDGFKTQIDGDTIHSDVYSPTWSNGTATVELPSNLDFWDLGEYTLSIVAVDRETGLRTEPVTNGFTIAWDHHAPDPDEFITLTPLDYTTEGGEHIQAVQIDVLAPTGSESTDLYDIYRMDGENAHLIGEDFPLNGTFIDEYAPFSSDSDLYYRIALKTADGDVEFADKPYELTSDTIRFDWQGGTLELPYGITIGDNYKKSVEFRQHMDGSVDGYWNPNIERGASYSSSIIKLIQPEEINLARQLARYAGAVFVRTANGSAFTADVQVTDLSVKNEAITAIAIDATEVGMTEEFMLPSPYELGDE